MSRVGVLNLFIYASEDRRDCAWTNGVVGGTSTVRAILGAEGQGPLGIGKDGDEKGIRTLGRACDH